MLKDRHMITVNILYFGLAIHLALSRFGLTLQNSHLRALACEIQDNGKVN